MDLGERHFSFRITANPQIEREAYIYNEAPQLLSFFPSGEGTQANSSSVTIDEPAVILSSIRAKGNGYEVTLFNSASEEKNAEVVIAPLNQKLALHFGGYELKIFRT